MNTNIIFITGDKFYEFQKNENVLSISEFEFQVHSGYICLNDLTVIIGQGIDQKRIQHLIKNITLKENSVTFWSDSTNLISKNLVHKHKLKNVMLTNLKRISADIYESNISINEEGEYFCDHQSGQHIQGMALIEAARQMFLAVTDKYYLKDPESRYSIITDINTSFSSFVFPIPAKLHYRIKEHEINNNIHEFKSVCEIIQSDKICVTIDFIFKSYKKDVIQSIESKLSKKMLSKDNHYSTNKISL